MKTAISLILLSTLAAQSACPGKHQRVPDCIALPETADKRELEISTKLAADLVAGIGKPSLAIEYKHKVDIAYAKLGQRKNLTTALGLPNVTLYQGIVAIGYSQSNK